MTYDEILTFLTIAEKSSIIKAANQLYIGQGTASNRLQSLEAALGIKLFYRQKGIKEVALTPDGMRFLPIAQQWRSLWEQAELIQSLDSVQELRISATDTLNRFLFVDIYKRFPDKYPNIQLTIRTEHSTKTHQLIENRQSDIGFAFNLHNYPNVAAKPLYREQMVFLYHEDSSFAHSRALKDLRCESEIYASYSEEYTLWHNRYFPNAKRKRITLGTNSMLLDFMGDVDTWTVVTQSIAHQLMRRIPVLSCCEIPDPPPARTAYLLLHKTPMPWIQEAADIFIREVVQKIRETPELTLLYPMEEV